MQHWTDFWKYSNSLSSFSESDTAEGYKGSIANLWESVTSSLPHEGLVLELGTGNGGVSAIIQRQAKALGKTLIIDACDLADIHPIKVLVPELGKQLEGINFHAKVNMEDLPFATAKYDLVVSQFAFEYSNKNKTLSEIERVLKPGGKVLLLCHHSESEISKESVMGAQILKEILNESPLFMLADSHLKFANEYLEKSTLEQLKQHQFYHLTLKTIHWIANQFLQRYPSHMSRIWHEEVVNRVLKVIDTVKFNDLSQSSRYLEHEHKVLKYHLLRITEQTKAALDEEDVKALLTRIKELDLQSSKDVFTNDGRPFAWQIFCQK